MKKAFIIISVNVLVIISFVLTIFFLFPRKFNDEIVNYSNVFDLEPSLVYSVINIESSYNPNAVSNAGAIGLMQLLPTTAEEIAFKLGEVVSIEDLKKPDKNIKYGCFYLKYLIDLFDGNIDNALCAYNWGLNNVKNWILQGNKNSDGTITNIPVKETKNYLKKYKVNRFFYKNIFYLK